MLSRDSIAERLKSNLNNQANKIEGSFAADNIGAVSQELELMYAYADYLNDMHYIDTAEGEFLDRKAKDYGLIRKSATKAIGTVLLSGTDGVVIPKGSIFLSDTLSFESTEETIIIDGKAVVRIEAVEAGLAGNIPVETINKLEENIQGITSISNTESLTGGTSKETDENFRERVLFKIQNPATSGNVAHYKIWGSEVPGTGRIRVFPLANGPGTVQLSILDANAEVATEELLQKVKQYIDAGNGSGEAQAPIGANLTVTTAKPKNIIIKVNLKLIDIDEKQTTIDSVQEALKQYFKDISYHERINYVSFAKITDILFDQDNVEDFESLTLNGASKNILLGDEEIPKLLKLEVI